MKLVPRTKAGTRGEADGSCSDSPKMTPTQVQGERLVLRSHFSIKSTLHKNEVRLPHRPVHGQLRLHLDVLLREI